MKYGYTQKAFTTRSEDMVRISDGRMSGTAFGTIILHVSPEASMALGNYKGWGFDNFRFAKPNIKGRSWRRGYRKEEKGLEAYSISMFKRICKITPRSCSAGAFGSRP